MNKERKEGRKERRKEGRKEGRHEGTKEGTKEGRKEGKRRFPMSPLSRKVDIEHDLKKNISFHQTLKKQPT
jgi:flagellar biosynthesis/type III secretory pathway protein FliH